MSAPNLQMYRSDTPTVEIGTILNPIDFGLCTAGVETTLPYDIILWNDKGGSLASNDAMFLMVELLKMYLTEEHISTGLPDQTYTCSYAPVLTSIEVEVLVDDVEWLRVLTFSGYGETSKVYMFDYTTGVLSFGNGTDGLAPPISQTIKVTYTADLNIFGKEVYSDMWISILSSGTIKNIVLVSIEEGTLASSTEVQTIHHPTIDSVIGVWDNDEKTGVNYYTGGSFNENTGLVTLGTPFIATTPYVEYNYYGKDDAEGNYTSLGNAYKKSFDNRLPQNNAKRLSLKVLVPPTADTEGGVYIRVVLRFYYQS